MSKTWFTCEASGDSKAEIHIYDEIGMWGVSAGDFNTELKALGPVPEIDLYINSPGGSVFDGISIYNMLKRHKATVTVHIDGIAASIASLIAMAGDVVIMPSNAMMMIHDPSGFVGGTSKEMRDIASALDKMKASMVAAYATKTGLPDEEVRQIMSDETWLSAAEAVDMGFADKLAPEVKMAAMFNLSKFKHPPEAMGSINRGDEPLNTEVTMTTKQETPAEMEARLRTEITAQLAADAVKAAADEKAKPFKKKGDEEDDKETGDEAEARVRAEIAEVVAMCELTGYTSKANDFIAKGLKPAQALAELQKLKAAAAPTSTTASQLRTQHQQQPGADGNASGLPDKVTAEIDANDIWARWNGRKGRQAA